MIINFKIFESVSVKPKLGDYVIAEVTEDQENKFDAIGTITNINNASYPYTIEFNDLNKPSGKFIDVYTLDELKYWSKNKEELETILTSNKYNL